MRNFDLPENLINVLDAHLQKTIVERRQRQRLITEALTVAPSAETIKVSGGRKGITLAGPGFKAPS